MTGFDKKMVAFRQRFIDRAMAGRPFLDEVEPDIGDLEMLAHRISGSAGMFGYVELGLAAEALEEAIRAGSDAETRCLLTRRLADEIDRLQPR